MKRIRVEDNEPSLKRVLVDKDQKPKQRERRKVDLLLDSGAFSAWNQGEVIELKDYIAYLKANHRYLWGYVSLDVLAPGEERHRTHEAVEAAAKQSYKNHLKMKDAGLKPIPVYHQGESLSFLDQMLADGETYIGVSCRKDLMAKEQAKWLDMVFAYLTDNKGRPLVKTHGFGITRPGFLFRYPFYTVDSTTWSLSPGYGQIIVPVPGRDGETLDFTVPPERVVISGVTHKTKSSQKKQYEALGGTDSEDAADENLQKAAVRKFLHEYVGISITEARYGTNLRRKAVLLYYINVCKALRDVHYRGPRATIFGKDHFDTDKLEAQEPFNLSVFYATSLSREWSALMNEVEARTRLLSYYELKDRGNDILQRYVLDGTTGEYIAGKQKVGWDSESYLNRRRLALHYRLKELRNEEGQEETEG